MKRLLAVAGFLIIGAAPAAAVVCPAGSAFELRRPSDNEPLGCIDDQGRFKISSVTFNSVDYDFPLSQGAAATFLKNDGSGDLTWQVPDQLAANGANCPAGQAPLGVDAFGAVESCTDYVDVTGDTMTGNLEISSATLHINGDAAIAFQIGASSFVVTSAGNVGILTASPEAPSHVVGNSTTTGTGFFGSVKINDVPNCTDATQKLFTDENGVIKCGTDAGASGGIIVSTFVYITVDFSTDNGLNVPQCVTNSTVTLSLSGDDNVRVVFSGHLSQDQANTTPGMSFLMDGDFVAPYSSTLECTSWRDSTVALRMNQICYAMIPASLISPGSHTFCAVIAALNAGAGNTATLAAATVPALFLIEQQP